MQESPITVNVSELSVIFFPEIKKYILFIKLINKMKILLNIKEDIM